VAGIGMFIGLISMITLAVIASDKLEYRDCDGYDEVYDTEVDLTEDDREHCDQLEKLAILAKVQIVSFEFMVVFVVY